MIAKFISDNFADFSGKFDGLLNVNYNFLGLDLTVMPGDVWKDFFTGGWPVIGVVLIPFISGALSFLQSKASMAGNVAAEGNDAAARSSRMMMWMMPLMSLWIGFTLPAALGVYWIVNSLLYAIQEKVLTKYYKSHMEDELSEKEKQKRDDRLRRMEAAREQQRKIAAEEAEKKTLKEKRAEKQAAKATKKKNSTNESGRVGDRPAREDRRENRAPRAERAERPAPQPKPIVDLGEECHDEKSEQIRAFLKGLLEHMDSAAEVKVYESEKGRYKVFLEGEKLGALIGRRGETLDAIQQLTNYSINRGSEKNRARVQVDAENYREKREQSLERLAEKVAGKVTKYRRNVTLEPMNAYERHVIHTALQDTPSVTTFSIGTEPNRRVVVSYDRTKA